MCLASHHRCSHAAVWLTCVFPPVQRDMDAHALSQRSSHLLTRCNLFSCQQEILCQASPLPGQHVPLTRGTEDSPAAREYSGTSKKGGVWLFQSSTCASNIVLHTFITIPAVHQMGWRVLISVGSSAEPPQSSGSVQRETYNSSIETADTSQV